MNASHVESNTAKQRQTGRPNFLVVSGFGWSGSGAIVDFLQGFSSVRVLPREIRLLKDVDGLLSLRHHFSGEGYFFNASIALRRFRRFCEVLGRENKVSLGLGYETLTNGRFSHAVERFCSEVVSSEFWSDAFVFQYSEHDASQLLWKIRRKMRRHTSGRREIFPVSLQKFDEAAVRLIRDCFGLAASDEHKLVILDQAVNPWAWSAAKPLLPEAKMIIVDRDPRDVFVDYQKSRDVLWNLEAFIDQFRELRRRTTLAANEADATVKFVRFENFILNFEATSNDIFNFLALDSEGIRKRSFDASRSRKNIGIFRTWHDQSQIKRIEKELLEFCFL